MKHFTCITCITQLILITTVWQVFAYPHFINGETEAQSFGHLRKSAKLINGKARVMSPGSLVTESGFLPASGFHFGLSWIVLGGKDNFWNCGPSLHNT